MLTKPNNPYGRHSFYLKNELKKIKHYCNEYVYAKNKLVAIVPISMLSNAQYKEKFRFSSKFTDSQLLQFITDFKSDDCILSINRQEMIQYA